MYNDKKPVEIHITASKRGVTATFNGLGSTLISALALCMANEPELKEIVFAAACMHDGEFTQEEVIEGSKYVINRDFKKVEELMKS